MIYSAYHIVFCFDEGESHNVTTLQVKLCLVSYLRKKELPNK
jgi:hypothetical protein